jgi:hypothetical protein
MWPVSRRYLDTLARSHDQLVAVDVLKGGDVVASLTNGFIADPVTGNRVGTVGGVINVDKTTIRRSGDLVLTDVSGQLLPDGVEDLFAPFSTELRVSVGVRYWDAAASTAAYLDQELVPVGTLVVTHPSSSYPQLTLEGYDRSWYLDNFQSPWTVAAGTSLNTAIIRLLQLKVPAGVLDYNIPDYGDVIAAALTFDADTSSAEALYGLAESFGYAFYCDPMGTFQLTAEPTTDDEPVMTYQRGEISTLLRPTRSVGDAQMVNAVVVTSEGTTTAPIRGYAQDDNPSSLTCVAKIGVHPTFISDPSIGTQAQADRSAARKLKSILGVSTTIAVPIIPNHALESGDVIVVSDDQQNLAATTLLVDSFTVPLRAQDGQQMLTCRSEVTTS